MAQQYCNMKNNSTKEREINNACWTNIFFFQIEQSYFTFSEEKNFLKGLWKLGNFEFVFTCNQNTCKYFILNQDCVYKCSQWIDNYDETELANWTEFNFESTSVLYKIDKHICYSFQIKS